jgi:hypothetical protein
LISEFSSTFAQALNARCTPSQPLVNYLQPRSVPPPATIYLPELRTSPVSYPIRRLSAAIAVHLHQPAVHDIQPLSAACIHHHHTYTIHNTHSDDDPVSHTAVCQRTLHSTHDDDVYLRHYGSIAHKPRSG